MVVKGRASIVLHGIKELETDFTRMQTLSQAGKTEYLGILATVFLEALVKFAPVRTGQYIRSWRVKTQEANRIVVGPSNNATVKRNSSGSTSQGISAARLAVILEFSGATPHKIESRNVESLAFGTGGDMLFFSIVNHPGMKPQPHIRPALMETKRKAKGILFAVAQRYMPRKKWKNSMEKAARANGYEGGIPPKQTGRNKKDVSANITRGTKGKLSSKLSRGLSGKRLRARGLTRAVGSSESARGSFGKAGSRIQGQGLERFR